MAFSSLIQQLVLLRLGKVREVNTYFFLLFEAFINTAHSDTVHVIEGRVGVRASLA